MMKQRLYGAAVLLSFFSLWGHDHAITKYILACGGFGTRMLPLTSSVPKEMVSLMGKPAMHVAVEEAFRSGLTQCFVITKRNKNSIEDYFDYSPELEPLLEKHGKINLIQDLIDLRSAMQMVYIRQPHQGGTGDAIMKAYGLFSDPYFAVGWPDVFMLGEDDLFATMKKLSQKYDASVVAVQEVPIEEVQYHGVVVIGNELESGVFEITNMVEKPEPKRSPSNLTNIGRFIVSQEIFNSLRSIKKAPNGELQFPDAILDMIQKGHRVIAYKTKGTMHDIGRTVPWLEGTIRYGLSQKNYASEVKQLIINLAAELSH